MKDSTQGPAVLVAALVLTQATLASAQSPGAVEETALDSLYQQYASWQSVHVEASISTTLMLTESSTEGESAGVSGTGRIEYWEKGNRYRVRSELDPRLDLMANMEIAFDGEHYQMLFLPDGPLSYVDGDQRVVPLGVPNPLYLPVAFLMPSEDDCSACQLHLSELGDRATWTAAIGSIRISDTASPSERRVRGPEVAVVGTTYSYVLRFEGGPSESRLTALRTTSRDGALLMETRFADFQPVTGGAGSFPRSVLVLTYDAEDMDQLLARIHYTIREIEVNQPIPDELFTISWDLAKGVWDSDAKAWMKGGEAEAGSR